MTGIGSGVSLVVRVKDFTSSFSYRRAHLPRLSTGRMCRRGQPSGVGDGADAGAHPARGLRPRRDRGRPAPPRRVPPGPARRTGHAAEAARVAIRARRCPYSLSTHVGRPFRASRTYRTPPGASQELRAHQLTHFERCRPQRSASRGRGAAESGRGPLRNLPLAHRAAAAASLPRVSTLVEVDPDLGAARAERVERVELREAELVALVAVALALGGGQAVGVARP